MTTITDLKTFNDSDEIDLRRLFKILWEGKNLIIGFTVIFSIVAVLYSLSLPNIYQSSALLSPVSKDNSNQSLKGVGGLATLAGIDINTSAGGIEAKAIKKLSTLSFFSDSIYPYIYLPDLMAIESWNPTSNTISYKNNLYKDDLEMQIKYYNKNYSWETRIQEWINFLNYVRRKKTTRNKN